ncbi:MAG: GFA family protein [Pseudomonadota bacterium]
MTDMETRDIQGHCLCGAVRLHATQYAKTVSACHCSMCRRWTGSAMWCLDVPTEALTVEGPVATYRSSAFAERAWCRDCGTHLWIRDDEGTEFELMPGLFDAAAKLRLRSEIYIDCAFACISLAGDHDRRTQAEYEKDQRHVEDTP